jgi:hypothetical protein
MNYPPPWKATVARHPDGTLNGRPYITAANGKYVCELFLDNTDADEVAAIIAAAPELLAECEAMLAANYMPNSSMDIAVRAQNVIEKATKAA